MQIALPDGAAERTEVDACFDAGRHDQRTGHSGFADEVAQTGWRWPDEAGERQQQRCGGSRVRHGRRSRHVFFLVCHTTAITADQHGSGQRGSDDADAVRQEDAAVGADQRGDGGGEHGECVEFGDAEPAAERRRIVADGVGQQHPTPRLDEADDDGPSKQEAQQHELGARQSGVKTEDFAEHQALASRRRCVIPLFFFPVFPEPKETRKQECKYGRLM